MSNSKVLLPLLECDKLILATLKAVRRNPELLDEITALIGCEDTRGQASAFHYLFIPTDCPTIDTGNCGVGFRLRNRKERLRYADECNLAAGTGHLRYEITVGH